MLYSRILAFVALAAIAHSAPTLPAKDPDRKGVIAAFEVGASTAKMAAENEALKTENEALKAMLKAKNHESEPVTGLEVHKEQEGGGLCPPPLFKISCMRVPHFDGSVPSTQERLLCNCCNATYCDS